MNIQFITGFIAILATALMSSPCLADPPNKDDWEARKDFQEHQREAQKKYQEMQREERKHQEEMEREERKHWEEMERETRKHQEEMRREERKDHKEMKKEYKKEHPGDYDSDHDHYDRDTRSDNRYWGGYDTRYSSRYGADTYGIGQGRCNRPQSAYNSGPNMGNAIGSAIGTMVGGGNSMMGDIAGAMVNQMLGNQIGQSMDDGDRFCFSQSLEYGYDQRPIDWNNGTNQYRIVPLRSFQNPDGNWCREFSYQLTQSGRLLDGSTRTACRISDGSWQ